MTCKDCLHFNACVHNAVIDDDYSDACGAFKDKSRFIELPCKVGDVVYKIIRRYNSKRIAIIQGTVKRFTISRNGIDIFIQEWVSKGNLGKDVFFTREEAEKALAKRGAK